MKEGENGMTELEREWEDTNTRVRLCMFGALPTPLYMGQVALRLNQALKLLGSNCAQNLSSALNSEQTL